jgi:hypothetical protein
VEDMFRLSILITDRLSLEGEPLLFMVRDFYLISPEIISKGSHKQTLPYTTS